MFNKFSVRFFVRTVVTIQALHRIKVNEKGEKQKKEDDEDSDEAADDDIEKLSHDEFLEEEEMESNFIEVVLWR